MTNIDTTNHNFTCLHDPCKHFYCCLQLLTILIYVFMLPVVLVIRRYRRRQRPGIEEAIRNLENSVRKLEWFVKSQDNFTLQQLQDKDRLIQSWIEILSSCKTTTEEKDSSMDTNNEENRTQQPPHVTIEIKPTVIPVQVYRKDGKGIKNEFIDELWNHLNCDLTTKMEFVECNRAEQIDPNLRTLVLCLTNSRLGSDAVNAVKDITVQANVALLVCHHQEIHALPNTPSERRLIESRFNGIGGIYDLAFTSDKGIYQCNMNKQAKEDIVKFVIKNS